MCIQPDPNDGIKSIEAKSSELLIANNCCDQKGSWQQFQSRPSIKNSTVVFICKYWFPTFLCGFFVFGSVSRPPPLLLLPRVLRHTHSYTYFSHRTLSHTTLSHTTLSHTIFVTHHLSHTTLSHTILSHTIFTHNFVTHNFVAHHLCHTPSFTPNFVAHHLSHTTLSHTTLPHTIFHTQLCRTPSFTHNFVTHTIFHTQLCHIQLCHTPSFTHNFVTHHLCGRRGTWRYRPAFVLRGRRGTLALGWVWWCAWGPLVARGTTALRGTWRRPPALCQASVALGDIHLHFAWQVRRLWHWAGSGGALGAHWSPGAPRPALCVAGVALGDTHLHLAWRGMWRQPPTFCAAGVALMALGCFAWQAWHLATSTYVFPGRRGTCSHQPSFCLAGVELGDIHAASEPTSLKYDFRHIFVWGSCLWFCIPSALPSFRPLLPPSSPLSHTTLSHTNFVTHHLSHTTLSHNFVAHNSSHTTFKLSILCLYHLLCPFCFLRAASTTFCDYWKNLTCGVIRSFNFWTCFACSMLSSKHLIRLHDLSNQHQQQQKNDNKKNHGKQYRLAYICWVYVYIYIQCVYIYTYIESI